MVDILVKDNKLYVASQYDKNLLHFMRSRQKRFWNTNTKKWEIPESELDNLIEVLQGYEYNIRYDGEQTESHTVLEKSEKLPIKDCVPEWYEYKTKPYQHQVDGISYGLTHDKFLLADEQGCIDGDMEVEAITEYGHFKGFLRDLFHMFIASFDKDKYKILCYIGGCLMDYYPLEKVLYSGEKECYGLQLEDGSYIIGTPDHEILTNKGYIPLIDVISPDYNTYVYKQDEEVPTYTKLVKADSLYYVGTKSVYDIVMKDPFRNFVANNIVAHNCGKTKQILDLSQIRKKQNNIKHVLIVPCVNGLKYNWFEEVKTHTNDKAFILGTRYTKNGERIGSNEDRLADINSIGKGGIIDDCYYLITNIETLRYNKVIKVPLKTKKNGVQRYKKQTIFPIIDAIQQQIRDGNIGMVVTDEIHKCLSSDTCIETSDGNIPIKQIVEAKKYNIKTYDIDTGEVKFVKPSNYFKNPKKKYLLNMTFLLDNGSVKNIKCTKEHKFLTKNRGYIEAQYLTEDDEVVQVDQDLSCM